MATKKALMKIFNGTSWDTVELDSTLTLNEIKEKLEVDNLILSFGNPSTVNKGEVRIDTTNSGSPQLSFTDHSDVSWSIGGDDIDNSFKIHGNASSEIPNIYNLTTPHFEITPSGTLYNKGVKIATTNDIRTDSEIASLTYPGGDYANSSRDITISDNHKILYGGWSGGYTLTLNGNTNYPDGFEVTVFQVGGSHFTIGASNGASIYAPNSKFSSTVRYETVIIKRYESDKFVLIWGAT